MGGANGTAEFAYPTGVAFDGQGNVLVADTSSNRIRVIDPTGNVITLAGNGSAGFADGTEGRSGTAMFWSPLGVAANIDGTVYVADTNNQRIRWLDAGVDTLAGNGDGGFADGPGIAAELAFPSGVAVDSAGNVYVADTDNQRIRKIDPRGNVTTIAGDGQEGDVDGPASSAEFRDPKGVAIDAAGNIYVADANNNRVRVIRP
jgi:DNA-binding beta-propeller fold protein YncE